MHPFAGARLQAPQQQPVSFSFSLSMLTRSAAGGAGLAIASMAVFGEGFLTGQESVKLDQQSGVGVVRLGCLAVARTDVVVVQTWYN